MLSRRDFIKRVAESLVAIGILPHVPDIDGLTDEQLPEVPQTPAELVDSRQYILGNTTKTAGAPIRPGDLLYKGADNRYYPMSIENRAILQGIALNSAAEWQPVGVAQVGMLEVRR